MGDRQRRHEQRRPGKPRREGLHREGFGLGERSRHREYRQPRGSLHRGLLRGRRASEWGQAGHSGAEYLLPQRQGRGDEFRRQDRHGAGSGAEGTRGVPAQADGEALTQRGRRRGPGPCLRGGGGRWYFPGEHLFGHGHRPEKARARVPEHLRGPFRPGD